jgi:hypothetical protein
MEFNAAQLRSYMSIILRMLNDLELSYTGVDISICNMLSTVLNFVKSEVITVLTLNVIIFFYDVT